MASVVLFHAVLGLRPAVCADAERLRAAGHQVSTPDLFDGHVFDDIDAGMTHRRTLDTSELLAKATAAADAVDGPKVFAGYSFGSGFAQWLVETRPDAAAGLFLSAGDPPEGTWPGVPAQVHAATDDPWVEEEGLVRLATLGVEVFRYRGGGHLFADPGLPDYDPASAELMWQRVLQFLERLRD